MATAMTLVLIRASQHGLEFPASFSFEDAVVFSLLRTLEAIACPDRSQIT